MDYSTIPPILKTTIQNCEPVPRDLDSLCEILEINYKLLEHPVLLDWNGHKYIDPFEHSIGNSNFNEHFNRILIERTISQSKFYSKIKLKKDGIFVMQGKGIEMGIDLLEQFMINANKFYNSSEKELRNYGAAIHFFRITQSGYLTGNIITLMQTCNELILLIHKKLFEDGLKDIEQNQDKKAYLLRWKADLHKQKDQLDKIVFNGLMEVIKIELEYLEEIDKSNSINDLNAIVAKFFAEQKARVSNHKLLHYLLENDMANFKKALTELVFMIFSYHDISGDDPEKVYHLFLLGLFNSFSEFYRPVSNKEAGKGRFDILLIPNTIEHHGVIVEVKKILPSDKQKINDILKSALAQIEDNKYCTELKINGINRYYAIAACFCGKELYIEYRETQIQ